MRRDRASRRRFGRRGRVGVGILSALVAVAVVTLAAPGAVAVASADSDNGDVTLAGDQLSTWADGRIRYFLFEQNCFVEQGLRRIRSDAALAWIDDGRPASEPTRIHLLVQGALKLEPDLPGREKVETLRTVVTTTGRVNFEAAARKERRPANHPLVKLALAQTTIKPFEGASAIRPVQFEQARSQPSERADPRNDAAVPLPNRLPGANAVKAPARIGAVVGPGGGTTRRLRAYPRHSTPIHYDTFPTGDGQQVFVVTGGINLLVEDLNNGDFVRILSDRIVLWTRGKLAGELSHGAETDGKQPLEVYLEGNVIIRQGNIRTALAADQMAVFGKQIYYDINAKRALILDGSVETYDPELGTPLFMKAAEIRQLTPAKFYATRASFTTSPFRGTPGYAFNAGDAVLEQVKEPIKNPFTGAEVIDPVSGAPLVRERYFATGYRNVLRIEDVPVFYWPYIRADVNDPLGPLETVKFGTTDNLGTYATVHLDMWQLLGLDYLPAADQSNWLFDVGYYGKRGPAGGSRFNYFASDLLGMSGPSYGNALTWWINDSGEDFLGRNRQGLQPPRSGRGRFRLQHHQQLPNDFTLIAEVSYLTDTNLLESFYEHEYDSGKDQDTLLFLKQARDDWAWTGLLQPRVNEFLPQNPWLPRFDGYLLGRSLLRDRLTYFNHSSLGYGLLRPPRQLPLVTDARVDTARLDTRHELDLPLNLGDVQVTPFVVGQFTGYTDTPTANGLGRLYGAVGVRSSLPFWKAYPAAESRLLNVHGLAHKVSLNADYLLARANRDYTELPPLDQLDDDTSELVRRQNLIRQFGGVVPLEFDPRFFALRNNVTTQPEVLDDMQNVRLSVTQHLQTKRGPIDDRGIVDWMILDMGTTIFPERNRDNFGELAGLLDYRYQWQIGGRTRLDSNMLYDPHDDTLNVSGSMTLQRPPRTSFAAFYSYFQSGPFQSNYVGMSNSYRFSRKYAGAFTTGYDFESLDNVSFTFGLSRVGLDFVTSVGFVLNAGRDDFGFVFEVYPRVQARSQYGRSQLQTLPFGVDPSEDAAPIVESRLNILNNNSAGF